jgi:hypothetical protein
VENARGSRESGLEGVLGAVYNVPSLEPRVCRAGR